MDVHALPIEPAHRSRPAAPDPRPRWPRRGPPAESCRRSETRAESGSRDRRTPSCPSCTTPIPAATAAVPAPPRSAGELSMRSVRPLTACATRSQIPRFASCRNKRQHRRAAQHAGQQRDQNRRHQARSSASGLRGSDRHGRLDDHPAKSRRQAKSAFHQISGRHDAIAYDPEQEPLASQSLLCRSSPSKVADAPACLRHCLPLQRLGGRGGAIRCIRAAPPCAHLFVVLLAIAGAITLIVAAVKLSEGRSPAVAFSAIGVVIVVDTLALIFIIQAFTTPSEAKPTSSAARHEARYHQPRQSLQMGQGFRDHHPASSRFQAC